MAKQKKNDFSSKFRVNDEIRFNGNVRIVGNDIESKVVTMQEARSIADSMELDLVEIQGNLSIPIIRVCNYEKMVYELKKAAKKSKQTTKLIQSMKILNMPWINTKNTSMPILTWYPTPTPRITWPNIWTL